MSPALPGATRSKELRTTVSFGKVSCQWANKENILSPVVVSQGRNRASYLSWLTVRHCWQISEFFWRLQFVLRIRRCVGDRERACRYTNNRVIFDVTMKGGFGLTNGPQFPEVSRQKVTKFRWHGDNDEEGFGRTKRIILKCGWLSCRRLANTPVECVYV